ncbi:hypothetical protein AA309_05845 [Microvirga vignae]|uniref:Uncharacterized protein n=1 Tax=Microvirga vignae TaxID=1225564 RepID=A0A0H1RFK9_9HYPH|nr:hypothetical protein AA309_05845 [Microvirga vignae]
MICPSFFDAHDASASYGKVDPVFRAKRCAPPEKEQRTQKCKSTFLVRCSSGAGAAWPARFEGNRVIKKTFAAPS